MPPKKLKPNVASDLPCDHAVMPSTTSDLPCDHAGKPSTTLDDPFSYPDVMTMSVKWSSLTGGGKKRFYVSDLASQPDVCQVVQRVMKPLIDYVQGLYPSLVCVKFGALKSLPNCPSQYEGHNNRFHSDYSSHYPELHLQRGLFL
jgi:hypothetical protein